MRAQLIDALRGYWPDADDATAEPLLLGDPGTPQSQNRERLTRLLLRALREHEQEIRELRQRVTAPGG
jgi:hypothetical protein